VLSGRIADWLLQTARAGITITSVGTNNDKKETTMNTITRTCDTALDAAIIEGKVRRLATRAAKKGIATDLTATTEVTEFINEVTGETDHTYTVTVSFSDLVRFTGGWVLTAVADGTATDEPMIFTLDDDIVAPTDVDMKRCDHCGRRAARKKVLFVRNDAGDDMQVGGSCAKDFLGHDPWWTTLLFDAAEGDIDDVERSSATTKFLTGLVIEFAINACRLGYVKANSEYGTPTKKILTAMLNGAFWHSDDFKSDRLALRDAPAATVTVQQVLDWMREQDGEFGANLRAIADSENIGRKAFGLVAYAPAGAMKWREEMAVKAAERAAEEARHANVESIPVGKVEVEGVVASVRLIENQFGRTLKMKVVSDAGWSVWGTVPKALQGTWEWVDFEPVTTSAEVEAGDRVRFTATIEPSEDDRLFGFFKRPTNAEFIERAKVSD
jgi:hypothetical protein